MNSRVAIVDLGTNTFHLLIAERSNNRFNILLRERRAVKIGMGGINHGHITEDGLQRAVQCLQEFQKITSEWHVEHCLALGTSALRNAANQKEVVKALQQASAMDIRIISGEEEARLIYQGVASAMNLGDENVLIVDIGGGSVEFIIGNSGGILWKRSFEIGAQRLLERFQKHDPIWASEIAALDDYFRAELKPLEVALTAFPTRILAGSSGTFDTLSDIHCIRHSLTLPPDASETPLTVDSFYITYDLLLSKNRMERLAIPGMIEMRVDMIVVACCLIRYLIEKFSFTRIRVSTYSLKEGALAEMGRGRL